MCVCVCTLSHFSRVQRFVIPWTVARQTPLSMGFSRQEYQSGLPRPSPEDLSNPGIKPASHMPLALAGEFSITSATWEAFLKKLLPRNIFIYSYFFGTQHVGSQLPNQGLKPCPLQCKHRVLTAGLLGRCRFDFIYIIFLKASGLDSFSYSHAMAMPGVGLVWS